MTTYWRHVAELLKHKLLQNSSKVYNTSAAQHKVIIWALCIVIGNILLGTSNYPNCTGNFRKNCDV